MLHLYYDGSFNGWLNAFAFCIENNMAIEKVRLSTKKDTQLFDELIEIQTDIAKAKDTWSQFKSKLDAKLCREFFVAFFSQDEKAIQITLYLALKVWNEGKNILQNFADNHVLYFAQTVRKVEREKHRMMAFVRFQKSTDGCYHCIIEPDYNVLPLIANFFKNRYADQIWFIYDIRRSYGLYYYLKMILEVQLCTNASENTLPTRSIELAEDERLYQNLWKDYFKSTNIVARRNLKLNIQHVPKRYWKYLIEK